MDKGQNNLRRSLILFRCRMRNCFLICSNSNWLSLSLQDHLQQGFLQASIPMPGVTSILVHVVAMLKIIWGSSAKPKSSFDSKAIEFTPVGTSMQSNPIPIAVKGVDTSLLSLGSSSGYMPLVPESSCQPPMSVSQPSLKRKMFGKIVRPNQYLQPNCSQKRQQRQKKSERQFDVLPVPYAQLLPDLLKFQLVQLRIPAPPTDKLPFGCDVNARCEFHSGAPGHSTENCKAVKLNVQDLINSKVTMSDGTSMKWSLLTRVSTQTAKTSSESISPDGVKPPQQWQSFSFLYCIFICSFYLFV